MRDKIVTTNQINDIFNAYLSDFKSNAKIPIAFVNQLAYAQTEINQQVNFDERTTISVRQYVTAVKLYANRKSINGYMQLASVLYVINGQIMTLTAQHVICFGHYPNGFLLVTKEDIPNAKGTKFSYQMEFVNQSQAEIINNPKYQMTSDMLREVRDDKNLHTFGNDMDLQKRMILDGTITFEDFMSMQYR